MVDLYVLGDSIKMLRETLCVAQSAIGAMPGADDDRRTHAHMWRLQGLIDECDRHRPLGPDGKHGDGPRCTPTCGCDAVVPVVPSPTGGMNP